MAAKRGKRRQDKWTHEVELAAALAQIPIGYDPQTREPIFMFSFAELKALSPKQIRARWRRDHHPIRKEDGGPETHWNLTWREKKDHEKKSGKEQTQRGKDRKIARRNEAHAQAMEQKGKAPIVIELADSDYAISNGRFGRGASDELITATLGTKRWKRKAPMPHGRHSKTKRKLNGKVVER